MNSPLLSILIVNYNGLAHLEECLGSIYSQEFRDFDFESPWEGPNYLLPGDEKAHRS